MRKTRFLLGYALIGVFLAGAVSALPETAGAVSGKSFAERLGWGPEDRVLIIHGDDLGMHRDVNVGSIKALEEGVLTSVSTMMPCPWVADWNEYLKRNPDVCNGLHLTLNAEWATYRWTPLTGPEETPGLRDEEGYMHRNVLQTALKATPDEVEKEIRAQIALAERMGMPITHLDTHMGTLAATPEFLERFVKVGVEKRLPILAVGGHATQMRQQWPQSLPSVERFVRAVWEAGLPVIDDLDMRSYGWSDFEEKKAGMIRSLREMRPGITQIIVHCAWPSDTFPHLVRNPEVRYNDTRVLVDPNFRRVIDEEGIILTNWRELMERRKQAPARLD